MPSYLDPRVGISQSQAFAEAATFAYQDTVLFTLAFYHSAIVDENGDPMAIYVVNDFEDFQAYVEADAPLDGGAEVTFVAVPMEITLPKEADQAGHGEVTIRISNVSRLLMPHLAAITQSMEPVVVIARVYMGFDPSGPAEMPPLRVVLRGAQATPTDITAQAGFGDVSNRRFPAIEYRRREFPGLV